MTAGRAGNPGEGLREGPAPKGRGGAREGYAPPQSAAGPQGTGTTRPPPRGRRGRRQGAGGGQRGTPPAPPPPPLSPPPPARGRLQAGQRDGGPAPPRRGCCTQGGDAAAAANAAARQAPRVGRPLTPAQPAAGRRLCADAVGRNSTVAPGDTQTRQPALMRTRPRPAPTTARRPVYTQGGCAGEGGGQGRGPRAAPEGGGEGNSGAAPPTPPRPAGHGGADPLAPPRPRGRPPSPRKDRDAREGDAAEHARRAPPHPPLPAPAGVAAGGRTRTSAQDQRTGHTRGRRTTTNRSSIGAAPPWPERRPQSCPPRNGRGTDRGNTNPRPPGPLATSPEGRLTDRPSPPPPPRQAGPPAAGCPATPAERVHREGMRRRREGG